MASLTNKAMTATPTSQSPLSGSSPALSPKRAPPRLLTQPLERRTQTLYHHHHQSRNDPMDIDQPDLVDDGASIDDDDDQDDDRVEDIDEEDDEDQAEIIRCICLYSDDDGNTIACDKCAVWQHMICVGVDPNNVPDLYRCEKCAPRPFDSERANQLQKALRAQEKNKSPTKDTIVRKRTRTKRRVSNLAPTDQEGAPKLNIIVRGRGRGRPRGRTKSVKDSSTSRAPMSSPEIRRKVREHRAAVEERRARMPHRFYYTNDPKKAKANLEPVPKPADAFEAEYYRTSTRFADLSYVRFGSKAIGDLVENICKSWDAENKDRSAPFSHLSAELTSLSHGQLARHIPRAMWDPLAPHPVSKVRRFGLFATDNIPADSFVADIKGTLVTEADPILPNSIPYVNGQTRQITAPYVFAHPASMGLEHRLVVDAREWAEQGGRYVRYSCATDGDEDPANAVLRSVIVQDDPSDTPGRKEPLNARLILAIFTTRDVAFTEEIILGPPAGQCLGYPCICEDVETCHAAKLVAQYEQSVKEREPDSDVSRSSLRCSPSMITRSNTPTSRRGTKASTIDDMSSPDEAEDVNPSLSLPSVPGTLQKSDSDYTAPAYLDTSKRLSREDKKLQDQLARIERMEREAERKRARRERRRTKSGSEPTEDTREAAPDSPGRNQRHRHRERDHTIAEEDEKESSPPPRTDSPLQNPSGSSRESSPTLSVLCARQKPRPGIHGWIFAMEELKARRKAKARKRKAAMKAVNPDWEDSNPSTEVEQPEPSPFKKRLLAAKRKLEHPSPPLQPETTNAEVPELAIPAPAKKIKVEGEHLNSNAMEETITLPTPPVHDELQGTAECTPSGNATLPPQAAALTTPPVRKVSLQEFMAKKKRNAEAAAAASALSTAVSTPAPSTPSISEGSAHSVNSPLLAVEFPFPRETSAAMEISTPTVKPERLASPFENVTVGNDTVASTRNSSPEAGVRVPPAASAEFVSVRLFKSTTIPETNAERDTEELPVKMELSNPEPEGPPRDEQQQQQGPIHFPVQPVAGLASIYAAETNPMPSAPSPSPTHRSQRRSLDDGDGRRVVEDTGGRRFSTLSHPSDGDSATAGPRPHRRLSATMGAGQIPFQHHPSRAPATDLFPQPGPAQPHIHPSRASLRSPPIQGPPPAVSPQHQQHDAYAGHRQPSGWSGGYGAQQPPHRPYIHPERIVPQERPGSERAPPASMYPERGGPYSPRVPQQHDFRRPPPRYLSAHHGAPRDYYDRPPPQDHVEGKAVDRSLTDGSAPSSSASSLRSGEAGIITGPPAFDAEYERERDWESRGRPRDLERDRMNRAAHRERTDWDRPPPPRDVAEPLVARRLSTISVTHPKLISPPPPPPPLGIRRVELLAKREPVADQPPDPMDIQAPVIAQVAAAAARINRIEHSMSEDRMRRIRSASRSSGDRNEYRGPPLAPTSTHAYVTRRDRDPAPSRSRSRDRWQEASSSRPSSGGRREPPPIMTATTGGAISTSSRSGSPPSRQSTVSSTHLRSSPPRLRIVTLDSRAPGPPLPAVSSRSTSRSPGSSRTGTNTPSEVDAGDAMDRRSRRGSQTVSYYQHHPSHHHQQLSASSSVSGHNPRAPRSQPYAGASRRRRSDLSPPYVPCRVVALDGGGAPPHHPPVNTQHPPPPLTTSHRHQPYPKAGYRPHRASSAEPRRTASWERERDRTPTTTHPHRARRESGHVVANPPSAPAPPPPPASAGKDRLSTQEYWERAGRSYRPEYK